MFNPEEYTKKITEWMKDIVTAGNGQGLIFGLSGGIDSAVVAGLSKKAFPQSTLGLIMPCLSDPQDKEDALTVANQFNFPTEVIELETVFNSFLDVLGVKEVKSGDLSIANIKPRLRMITLYYYAAKKRLLVSGTSNLSELETGYFTKYGDSGVDLMPLGNLVKKEVVELARYLDVPSPIRDKPPSGGLWLGQTDEEEMGLPYAVLDQYLREGIIDNKEKKVKILEKKSRSEHKRKMPPIPEF